MKTNRKNYTDSMVSDMTEAFEANPSYETIFRLADYLDKSPRSIIAKLKHEGINVRELPDHAEVFSDFMYINSINLGVFTFWGKAKLFADKKCNGSFEIFFENGQSYQKGSYKNGKLDGPFEIYRNFDKSHHRGNYKNGKLDGLFEIYRKFDKSCRKGNYHNGKLDGPFEYYCQGQLVEKFNLKNYKREGPFKKYHDNGKLLMKGNYKNGKLDGPFENYWHNGKLSDKGIYKNGKRF